MNFFLNQTIISIVVKSNGPKFFLDQNHKCLCCSGNDIIASIHCIDNPVKGLHVLPGYRNFLIGPVKLNPVSKRIAFPRFNLLHINNKGTMNAAEIINGG
jgi:hypothetical protein